MICEKEAREDCEKVSYCIRFSPCYPMYVQFTRSVRLLHSDRKKKKVSLPTSTTHNSCTRFTRILLRIKAFHFLVTNTCSHPYTRT
jgi:hypothetical protein